MSWLVARNSGGMWEYFSYDKAFTNPQGGWSTDKAIALAFSDQRSADQFRLRHLGYSTTESVRG